LSNIIACKLIFQEQYLKRRAGTYVKCIGGIIMKYNEFLIRLSNPARRALEFQGIDSFEKLASLSKKELLSFHGVGPKSLPIVTECLNEQGLKLKD